MFFLAEDEDDPLINIPLLGAERMPTTHHDTPRTHAESIGWDLWESWEWPRAHPLLWWIWLRDNLEMVQWCLWKNCLAEASAKAPRHPAGRLCLTCGSGTCWVCGTCFQQRQTPGPASAPLQLCHSPPWLGNLPCLSRPGPELQAGFLAWPQPCLGTNIPVRSLGCISPWSLPLNLACEKKI